MGATSGPREGRAARTTTGAWRAAALCAETDPEVFFPEKSTPATWARRICAACEVQVECLAEALDRREAHGIWAGTTVRQRRRLWQSSTNATDATDAHDLDGLGGEAA